MEQALYIGKDKTVFSMWYLPDPGAGIGRNGYVMLHPFAEEKKSAHRTLVNLARQLCGKGHAVVLFDLYGCGDSGGDFGSARLERWLEDIDAAVQGLRERAGVERTGFIGLRLGVFLGLLYRHLREKEGKGRGPSVWIAPLLEPAVYLRRSLRRNLIRELITDGAARSDRRPPEEELKGRACADLGGYRLTPALYADLTGTDRKEILLNEAKGDTFVPVHRSGAPPKKAPGQTEGYPDIRMRPVRMEPFWDRVDGSDDTELLRTVLNIVEEDERNTF